MQFDIKCSNKAYIDSKEHFIIAADGVVYLRIVGSEGSYVVITATAGEDSHGEMACSQMAALNEAALRTAKSFGLEPSVKRDYHGREYIELCRCEFISDAHRAAERLFELFDQCRGDRTSNEMVEIYSSLANDDSGEDIYLSDGLWLSSDGSISDRGR